MSKSRRADSVSGEQPGLITSSSEHRLKEGGLRSTGSAVFDWLVDRGYLDRWRGKRGWLGRAVLRADKRWLQGIAKAAHLVER